jgi:ribosomal protein L40E
MKNEIKQPSVNICINKSRVKIYDGILPTVYLQSKTEFQIELFNPTQDTVMAKIKLNNKHISQGGLVLRPGERVFLDRYIDVAKKFLFETYTVEDSNEVAKAIEKNGDLVVEFFNEINDNYNFFRGILDNTSTGPFGGPTTNVMTLGNGFNRFAANPMNSNIGTNYHTTLGLTGMNNDSTTTTTYSSPIATNISSPIPSASSKMKTKRTSSAATLDMYDFAPEMDVIMDFTRGIVQTKSIETGRVESGSASKQRMVSVDKKFSFMAFHKVEYKLLPISQKINKVEELNIKLYCTNCGAKLGKGDNFCSRCGTKN